MTTRFAFAIAADSGRRILRLEPRRRNGARGERGQREKSPAIQSGRGHRKYAASMYGCYRGRALQASRWSTRAERRATSAAVETVGLFDRRLMGRHSSHAFGGATPIVNKRSTP